MKTWRENTVKSREEACLRDETENDGGKCWRNVAKS